MRALAALLLAMASACRHARPETDTRVPDVTDFCCTAADCCGVRYFDEDGGVHVQPCGPRMVGGHVPPEALSAWLVPEVGGSEELADATPRDALARGEHPPQAAGEFVVRCEEAYMPPVEPGKRYKPRILGYYCHRQWSDGGISPCEPLDSCL